MVLDAQLVLDEIVETGIGLVVRYEQDDPGRGGIPVDLPHLESEEASLGCGIEYSTRRQCGQRDEGEQSWWTRHGSRNSIPTDPVSASPRDAVILPMVRRSAPERPVLPVEEDGVYRPGRSVVELEPVTHPPQLLPSPRRSVIAQRQPPWLRLMVTEGVAHLITRDVRRFDCLLHVHPELHDVQEALQQVLVLRVATLHRKREERLAVLHGETRSQRHAGTLAGDDHVERVIRAVGHELLPALTHADPGVTGDDRRNPTARRRHRHDPA